MQIISILLLIFVGLPALALGSCFVLMTVGQSSSRPAEYYQVIAYGVAGIALFAGLLFLTIMSFKKK
jgi:hypothetical protein